MVAAAKVASPKTPSTPAVEEGAGGGRPAPLTPEELADRLVPAEPRISPDGRAVVFVVAPAGRKEERQRQALWIARDGGPARPLTAGTAYDASPSWSPDGRRILFASDRLAKEAKDAKEKENEERFRLFLLSLDGGEATPLGDLEGELTMPTWSPDGRTVAVLRTDPEPADEKRRKEERDDAIVADENPRYARLWLVDVETGRARCLTYAARRVWSYAWTPDGSGLVFLTTDEPEINACFGRSDLWFAPAAGGLPRHLATFPTLPGNPVVVETADGPLVVVKADGHRADPSESIWAVPQTGGEPRNLLPNYPGVVDEVVEWPGAPGRVAVRIVERTRGAAYGFDVTSGDLTPLTPRQLRDRGSVQAGLSVSADGSRLALIWADGTTPEEVWLGDSNGSAAAVTTFGEAFRGRLQPVEVVRWASTDGVEIEGLLTYPAGYRPGRRYPLVVEVHGGPSWHWDERVMLDWHDWAQMLASHGYAVLGPNPRGSTGYGSAFQQLLQDDVGGGEAQDLISGARAMVDRGIADPDRLGIGGWSWGGYLTAWTVTQTDLFKAAVMGAGLSNMVSDHGQDDIPAMNLLIYPGQPYDHVEAYWRCSPIRFVANVKTPTLILHGDADARVHPAQGMEFHRALKTLGVPVQFVRYPREGHGIKERAHQIDLMRRLVAWFDRWLKGESPSAVAVGGD